MKCPNCGTPEQGRVRVCPTCGTAYALEDLQELRQLEFLLAETATWPEADVRSKPYTERLAALKSRILPMPPPAAAGAAPQIAAPLPEPEIEPLPARPAPEPIPFDQWLLSERNIKIALYSGGALLVLAGLIFVGVNWARIPGPAKFAITLMVTGLMYLGGYLLFQRPTLRLGGAALLGIGSGFVPLNFGVLQIYIFSARGLSANVMWFIGSLPTLLLYVLTAYWTRADLFTYLSLGAVVSALTAALVLLGAPLLVFALAYTLLLLVFLLGARTLQPTRLASFTRTPLLNVSQLTMPVLFTVSAAQWVSDAGCDVCRNGSPWLALTTMLIGVIFYVTTDIAFRWLIARWVVAFTFALTFVLFLIQLGFSGTATGISLMVLALAYLLVGYTLERRSDKRSAAWPLYAVGYAVAAFVTLQALVAFGEDPDDLAKTLIGDVILLAVSAWVHRQYEWVYGATWVFIAPVFIYASLYLQGLSNQGLVLGVLMLNYAAAGYALGRRALRLGGPFLTAAVFLSVAVVVLTWANAVVASITLALIAVLYLFAALWWRWSWLLLPALAAVNVAVVSILRIFFTVDSPWEHTLTVLYAGLGVVLTLGGAWLRQVGQRAWGWPLYLVALLDVAGSYLAGVYLGGPIAIGLSVMFALLAFGLAWIERAVLAKAKLPPLLTYLGAALIFVGHFYVIELSSRAWRVWPAYTAGLCALFMVLAWLLRRESVRGVYGTPLRWAGSWLMPVPLGGSVFIFEPLLGAVTFAIAGITYAADAAVRRILRLGYLAGGAFVVVIWAILLFFEIGELQAYTIPLGLGLLALGWNERRQGGQGSYRWPTLLGLLILMGSAFYQSLDAVIYAVLLLIESLAALAWGIRIHSRGYVQLGVLSLVANAIAQLGPGFVELPRWIQLGVIGSILLGGGLVALFQREQLLASRQRLTEEWRQWEA
jgi:hypothetical protein